VRDAHELVDRAERRDDLGGGGEEGDDSGCQVGLVSKKFKSIYRGSTRNLPLIAPSAEFRAPQEISNSSAMPSA
jgi:hypothetical protein